MRELGVSLFQLWSTFWSWTLDQKIQFSILLVTFIGICMALFFEVPRIRRRLKVLSFEIECHTQNVKRNDETEFREQKFSFMELEFSNVCRRPIRILNVEVFGYSGLKSDRFYIHGEGGDELNEGDRCSVNISFDNGWLHEDDLKLILITDSMGKPYHFYFYEGEKFNKWLWRFLYLLGRWP